RAGLLVIQKLRELAIFFNSPLRLPKLKKVEELYGLPAINTAIDAKPRVGYAVTLMRRSVYNHYAFTQYFINDWRLIIEMKAITDQLAQFSLGEMQKEGAASLYALLFCTMLTSALELESMDCLVLERPNPTRSEFSQRRIPTKLDDFSCGAK
ncbi:hypothetical protein JG687_00017139, partial [Phytophthora cactorum]